MSQTLYWVVPSDLPTTYTKSRVLRSSEEQGAYTFVAEIDTYDSSGAPVSSFVDPMGTRQLFYQVRYFNPTSGLEYHDFSLGFFPFTPREKRILGYIVGWIPDLLKPDLTDFDVGFALRLGLNDFNIHPPETDFTIDNFPNNYEQFLVAGAQVHIVLQKYLKVAIRDMSYGDAGLSLNIDRGSKLTKAREDVLTQWTNVIALAKWNFINQGVGLGTVPLPISLGGNLNRGLLNALDIFTMMGR